MSDHHTSPQPLPVTAKTPARVQLPLDGVLVFGGFLFVCLIELLTILVLNDGKFVYGLDDPYIHLAVAEEIARGNYGVNQTEFSAPCSSPIWPLLLVPVVMTPLGELWPFILNFGFGLLVCWIVLRGVRQTLTSGAEERGLTLPLARVAVVGGILLCCNLHGLVFGGMEHVLQVLLVLLVVDGMIQMLKTGTVSRLFLMAVVIGPWVRYENLSLTVVACGVLFYDKRPRLAFTLGLSAVAGLFAFSGFLAALGLPLIPSSIQAKSYLVSGNHMLDGVLNSISMSFNKNRGVLLLMMIGVLLSLITRPSLGKLRVAALSLVLAGGLHVCFGAYGWYHRYECYIYVGMLYGIWMLWAGSVEGIAKRWTPAITGVVLFFSGVIGYPYLTVLFNLPLASNNIYEQQYQMHRFATEWWKKPLAVNDLGWVSYKNDQYILDLWGLASSEALKARLEKRDPSWMTELAKKHDVDLAIVYNDWVPLAAAGWKDIAMMRLSRERVSSAVEDVVFYARTPEAAKKIEDLLLDFRKTLPPGVLLVTRSDMQK